jgi:hypothetical protein
MDVASSRIRHVKRHESELEAFMLTTVLVHEADDTKKEIATIGNNEKN